MGAQLDARGLRCPLPVLKMQDFALRMHSGEEVTIICTDPGALQDIPAWCSANGHQVVCIDKHDQEIGITVKVNK